MPINGVIERFKTGVYVVTRIPEGTVVEGELVPATVPDDVDASSVDAVADTITAVAHGFLTGDGPVKLIGGGTLGGGIVAIDLPAPLSDAEDYWIIRIDDDTLQLAASEADAIALVAIDLTSEGSGGLTFTRTGFQTVMCIQPLDGRDLDALVESDQTSETKLAFVAVPLSGLNTRMPGFEPDSVEVYGESYTVIKSERWDHWGTTHWRCHIARDEVT